MKLIKTESITKNVCYDISVEDTNCFFANDILVHNSHLDVVYNEKDGLWCQSRENVITPLKDNAGSAFFCEGRKDILIGLINKVYERENLSKDHTVMLCGEFAGGNIQKNVGIANIEKSMFIFGVKITKLDDPEFVNYWVDYSGLSSPENRIYNMLDFKTYDIEIDFNHPELSQNKISELVDEIEADCPVARALVQEFPEGTTNIGEGVVFEANVVKIRFVGDSTYLNNTEVTGDLKDFIKNNFVEGTYSIS